MISNEKNENMQKLKKTKIRFYFFESYDELVDEIKFLEFEF